MNRDFKGIWIPREIWLNRNLSPGAKFLWGVINDHQTVPTNRELMSFLGIGIKKLKKLIQELKDINLLGESNG